MSNILNINQKAAFDNTIKRVEWHNYIPYAATSYDNNDEIRIPIHFQDIYTSPWDSYITIEGNLLTKDGAALQTHDAKLCNNGFAFLFDEIRYELFGIEVDKVKNVGITTTMKGYASLNSTDKIGYAIAGWDNSASIIDKKGYFSASIPLKLLLGFAEDYKFMIVNAKQELVLIRSRSDANVYKSETEYKINIAKIQWRIKHILPSDEERLVLLNKLNKMDPIEISFRSWDLYEYPMLPNTDKQLWTIKTTTQLEKPRYIILAFQTKRHNLHNANTSAFDHCNIRNVKLHLNSEYYPYESLNINFSKNQYNILYEMYLQFSTSYYHNNKYNPFLTWSDFKNTAPLIVIDCSKQDDALKHGTVDIKLEFESSENFPPDTTALCLCLHDKVLEYIPLSGIVRPTYK